MLTVPDLAARREQTIFVFMLQHRRADLLAK